MRTYPDELTNQMVALSTEFLRAPSAAYLDTDTGPVLEFEPPLSVAEQAIYSTILALARSGMTHLTPTEYATVRSQLVTIRDLRQMGRNAFMALTATERDRLLYDAQSATTTILLAILRE